MERLFKLNITAASVIFVVLDLICVGMGMGVPIFCIVFGFPLGWYIAMRVGATSEGTQDILRRILIYAVGTAGFTFLVMAVLWGPTASMLFDPSADLANFGVPMILYEPTASFVGWLILMIAISPFLQLLATIFGSHLTLLVWLQNRSIGE